MESEKIYKVNLEGVLSLEQYQEKYRRSIDENEDFWREEGKRINWIKDYTQIKDVKYSKQDTHIRWYYDGTLNMCYNCVDRHLENGKGDVVALIWEPNDPKQESIKITYRELSQNVNRLANGLRSIGVKKGSAVSIYMPMIPEIVYAMLACVRIGAFHSVIFGGFSPSSISSRIDDCKSDFVMTADYSRRGNKNIPLKSNIDEAVSNCKHEVKKVIVVKDTGDKIAWNEKVDVYYHDLVSSQSDQSDFEEMGAEDPLFVLYTSGSTGAPKGVLHTTGGYSVYASMTHQYVFNYQQGDIYWCTADCGWITGHSYVVYGPLLNGATTLIFEGIPNYPTNSRIWEIVDKHSVNILYTAPTAIRALMAQGDEHVKKTSRKSLRILGSVGEPINPEAWEWYYRVVGEERCAVTDTWWQTETGGIMIAALPGTIPMKPGSASLPFFGIVPTLVDSENRELSEKDELAAGGNLCLKQSWPGQMRTLYGNHQRFIETYFSAFEGRYFTGDGCKKDADGYYWITGRVDDVIIVSGHNLSTAEIESALVEHPSVAEAAVVGYPHDVKGYGLYAFVILNHGVQGSTQLEQECIKIVRTKIGPIATPDFIQFTTGLPKTRSGKIMRRILRKIAAGEQDQLGDVSTLADPSIVQEIITNFKVHKSTK